MSNSKKDNASHASELEQARAQETKEAKKKLKEAEKAKAGKASKTEKPKKKAGKKVGRFFKDFRGEIKKILWPDFRTVMKNTGIVLITVLIIGILVWALDFGLTSGIQGLKILAQNTKPVTTTAEAAEGQTTAQALNSFTETAAETEPVVTTENQTTAP